MKKITFYFFMIFCLLFAAACSNSLDAIDDDPVIPDSNDYLCFTANEDGCSVSTAVSGSLTATPSLEYSRDKENWDPFVVNSSDPSKDTTVDLTNAGDKVYIRATSSNASFSEREGYISFVISGSVSASGSIMSLLDKNCSGDSVPDYAFDSMFQNCSSLTAAPALPATTLADSCYKSMFEGCSNLSSITVYFTEWNDEYIYTTNWVNGVAGEGTFTCPSSLPEEYGADRIPTGWTKADL